MSRHIKTDALAGTHDEADARTRATVEAIIADVKARGGAAAQSMRQTVRQSPGRTRIRSSWPPSGRAAGRAAKGSNETACTPRPSHSSLASGGGSGWGPSPGRSPREAETDAGLAATILARVDEAIECGQSGIACYIHTYILTNAARLC